MWKHKLLIGCIVFFFLVGGLLVGCQSDEQFTPTPFPPTPKNMSLGASGSLITPVPAMLVDVMANPEFYEGAHVQVTGQYFRKPLQVCGIDPHPSPAGWELAVGETRLPAGGFNAQLRQLLPDGITMTVIGRLTFWRGPVGCGKQAVSREMWYIDVVKLVDPAQLALVTLTPGSGSGDLISDGGIADELFTPVADSSPQLPVEDDISETAIPVAPPTNTMIPTQAVPVETLSAGFTPVATDDIDVSTPTGSETATATGTAVTTLEGTAVSTITTTSTTQATPRVSTVTNTPPPGSTATPTSATTPIPTANIGGSFVTTMEGDIGEFDFRTSDLKSDEIQEWNMPLDLDEEVIVSVIGEPGMDISITILDESLNELVTQNSNLAGEAESASFNPPNLDDFKVQISEINGNEGGYLLTIGVDGNLMPPQGSLIYDSAKSSTILIDELHYWFFKGSQNDVIDLVNSSEAGSNLLVSLYGPDGDYVEDLYLIDEISDAVLPESGWYVIELEEWGLDENDYQITISKQ